MKNSIYQRDYSIGEILGTSWTLFINNFKLIFLTSLIYYVPLYLFLFILTLNGYIGVNNSIGNLRETFIKEFIILGVFNIFIGVLPAMTIAYIIKKNVDGENVNFIDATKKSLEEWWHAVGTDIIRRVFLIGLYLLFIVPGIIFRLYWRFAMYSVVLKGKTDMKALNCSKSVVHGRWWKVFGYFFVFFLLALLVALFATLVIFKSINFFIIESTIKEMIKFFMLAIFQSIFAYFTVINVIFFINLDATKKVKTLES